MELAEFSPPHSCSSNISS